MIHPTCRYCRREREPGAVFKTMTTEKPPETVTENKTKVPLVFVTKTSTCFLTSQTVRFQTNRTPSLPRYKYISYPDPSNPLSHRFVNCHHHSPPLAYFFSLITETERFFVYILLLVLYITQSNSTQRKVLACRV